METASIKVTFKVFVHTRLHFLISSSYIMIITVANYVSHTRAGGFQSKAEKYTEASLIIAFSEMRVWFTMHFFPMFLTCHANMQK